MPKKGKGSKGKMAVPAGMPMMGAARKMGGEMDAMHGLAAKAVAKGKSGKGSKKGRTVVAGRGR